MTHFKSTPWYYIVLSVADRYYSHHISGEKLCATAKTTCHFGELNKMKDALTEIACEQVNSATIRSNGQVYDRETKQVIYSRSKKYFRNDIYTWTIMTRAEIKKQYGVDPEKR